ncbi:MAG: KH domain-containing protein [Bacilli bacterium]|nr:KH domain-containing protein [Bacilli bacterium]
MHKYSFEGKNYEELINRIKEELKTDIDDLYIKKEEKETGLFKTKKYILDVYKKEDVIKYVKDYLIELGSLMNIDIKVEIRNKDNVLLVQMISSNNQVLIGKDGKTLNSIQVLLKQSLNNYIDNLIINLDVSNYKEKRLKRIENLVKEIVKEVKESKIDVSLDPMNSYERRFIHNYVSEIDNLTTESVGEGIERHIVIKYVEK